MVERIASSAIEEYRTYLKEPHRPPSRGGNTRALHSHVLQIRGEVYSFLALGSQQWVYKSDRVSFEFELNGGHRNIRKETLITVDSSGRQVIRGNRAFKLQLRSAPARLPGSRREQRD